MAASVETNLLASGAVGEGNVVVGDIVEEVNLVLRQHETGGDGVHRRVTPTLVEETTILVEGLEVVDVGL